MELQKENDEYLKEIFFMKELIVDENIILKAIYEINH
jgi:hypothetical protein